VDLRSERATGRLAVYAVHLEEAVLSEEARLALGDSLRALAHWLGLDEVWLAPSVSLRGLLG